MLFLHFIVIVFGLSDYGFCYRSESTTEWTTVASTDYNCIHERNITFYGFKSHKYIKFPDYIEFHEYIQRSLGICFTVNIFSTSIKKIVSVNSRDFMAGLGEESTTSDHRTILSDLQMLSDEIADRYHVNRDTKQTLVFFCTEHRQKSRLIFKELQRIKEKGWDIIIICTFSNRRRNIYHICPIEEWIPVHLIFPVQSILWLKLNDRNTSPKSSQFIHALINPAYDRTKWLMKVELDGSFTKSCFSIAGRSYIVFHISINQNLDHLVPLIRNAIVVSKYFPRHKIHFQFLIPSYFERVDREFIDFLLKNYEIDNKIISFNDPDYLKGTELLKVHYILSNDNNFNNETVKRRFPISLWNLESINNIMHNIEHATPKKTNIFLISLDDITLLNREKLCVKNIYYRYSKSEVKNIHFFTYGNHKHSSHLRCLSEFFNIHNGVDFYNEEHFFEFVNKLACSIE